MHEVKVGDLVIGKKRTLTVMSGPCVIESEEHAFETARELKKIASSLPIQLIYKSSYDKANRSSYDSFRGPGIKKGLEILKKIKEELDLPVLTDVHTPEEAKLAAKVCDIIQIPAFLCRQTDLVVAAAETGAVINVKKGQFMAPWDMENVVEKITKAGNNRIILTERGVSFGYNNLVSDMRSIPIMQKLGYPVCFDASHSTQLPGGMKTESGGQREFIPYLSRAAIAAGANALFIESHPNPSLAKSDKATVFPLSELKTLLQQLVAIYDVVQKI